MIWKLMLGVYLFLAAVAVYLAVATYVDPPAVTSLWSLRHPGDAWPWPVYVVLTVVWLFFANECRRRIKGQR